MEAEFSKIFFLVNPGTADGESPLQKLTRLLMIRPTARPPHNYCQRIFLHSEQMPEMYQE